MDKKKLPTIVKLTIVLSIISIILLIITISTSIIKVKRVEDKINQIGVVKLDLESESRIDEALNLYLSLDTNINLDKRVGNKELLDSAIYEYTRLAIKKANVSYNRRIVDSISDETLVIYVTSAYNILDKYYEESEYINIEGYTDFKNLLDVYKKDTKEENNNIENESSSDEEIEIC